MANVERQIRFGACSATIFSNEVKTANGPAVVRSVSLQRAYRDKTGTTQYTTSLRLNDIPKAIAALQQAYEWLLTNKPPQPQKQDTLSAIRDEPLPST